MRTDFTLDRPCVSSKPTWMYILDGLPVVVEDVYSYHSLVELGVSALNQLIVQVLLIVQSIEAFEDKVEEGVKVLRAGRGDEDVGVAEAYSGGDGETQGSGLASPSSCCEGDCGLQGLLRDGLDKL